MYTRLDNFSENQFITEGSSVNKWRFKTEEEMIKDYGHEWRDPRYNKSFDFPEEMDYLLGTPFNEDFPKSMNTITIPRRDNNTSKWHISHNFLILTTPDYSPKKIIRTLESQNSKFDAVEVVIMGRTLGELSAIEREVDFFGWPLTIDMHNNPYYPWYIFFNLVNGSVTYCADGQMPRGINGKIDYTTSDIFEGCYEKIYTIEELDEFVKILQTKRINQTPTYAPRKIIRTLESVDEFFVRYPYDDVIIIVNNVEELNEITPYIEHLPENERCINYLSSSLDYCPYYIRFEIDSNNDVENINFSSVAFLNSRDFIYRYEKKFSVHDIKTGLLNRIKRTGKSTSIPDYSPKKIKRTLESVNESFVRYPYDDVIIIVNNEEEFEICLSYIKVPVRDSTKRAIKNNLRRSGCYIRLTIDKNNNVIDFHFGSISYLEESDFENIYEKKFSVKDVKNGLLDRIKKYGISLAPDYSPKKIKRTLN